MAKRLVELRSGTRYRGVYESRDSFFSVINPPHPPGSLKGCFLQRSETGCFPLISLTTQGLNLREGRRRDHSQVIRADIHQHSDPPPTLEGEGPVEGWRPGEDQEFPVCFRSTCRERAHPCKGSSSHQPPAPGLIRSHSGINCIFPRFPAPPPHPPVFAKAPLVTY